MSIDHETTTRTGRGAGGRAVARGAAAIGLAIGLLGTAPGAQANDGYANCSFGAKFPGSEQRWAMCNADAPGTEFRAVVRCTSTAVIKGEWTRQGIGEKSWTMCITGSVTDIWREVR